MYYEALDITVAEIKRRFEPKTLQVLNEIENILIPSCNGLPLKHPSSEFAEMYNEDIDFERLKPQLLMLPELVKVSNAGIVKEVTSINTLCDLINGASVGKAMFSEIHKLLLLYLTTPLTSASAECTFSTLRRLKNYLRVLIT